MTPVRILVTGSRAWTDRAAVRAALVDALATFSGTGLPVLVHGAAAGADQLADEVWKELQAELPNQLGPAEDHPAADHPSPRHRNQHMVDLGATVCLAFADRWASGTGMCARMARAAGIIVVDVGVSTDGPRPPRQVAKRPDGTEVVQDEPPRADLLRYPGTPLVTVLVRRTHDVDLARELAAARWTEHLVDAAIARSNGRCLVVGGPALGPHRTGWWTTSQPGAPVPPRGAVDERRRAVVWCEDPARAHAAGAGVEFRP